MSDCSTVARYWTQGCRGVLGRFGVLYILDLFRSFPSNWRRLICETCPSKVADDHAIAQVFCFFVDILFLFLLLIRPFYFLFCSFIWLFIHFVIYLGCLFVWLFIVDCLLFVYLSVWLFIVYYVIIYLLISCLFVYLSPYSFVFLFICLLVYLSSYLFVLFICLVYLFSCLFSCLFIFLFAFSFICVLFSNVFFAHLLFFSLVNYFFRNFTWGHKMFLIETWDTVLVCVATRVVRWGGSGLLLDDVPVMMDPPQKEFFWAGAYDVAIQCRCR